MAVVSRATVEYVGLGLLDQGHASPPGPGSHQVRTALVEVDRALWTVVCAAPAVDRAEQAAGADLDDLDRAAAPAADVGQVGGPLPAGPVPARGPAAQQLRGHQLRRARPRSVGAEQSQVLSVSGISAAAAHRCGARTYGLSGSRTVDSTGWSNRASGWWTRKVSRGSSRAISTASASWPARPARPACCQREARVPG